MVFLPLCLLLLGGNGLEEAAARAMSGRTGTVAVIDIASGRLLAAHRPDIAARRLAKPGSTLKPFTAAYLLSSGAAKSGSTVVCRRELRIGGRRLDCAHPESPEPMTAAAAIAYSCNSYFANMALRLDAREFTASLRRAGLASGDVAAVVREAAEAETRQLQALGEANVLVTPMGLLGAYRRLALDAALHPVVREGLEDCVRFGTGQLAGTGTLRVAGKTGTATNDDRTYTHGWFVGYAPAAKPEIVVVVFIERGQGGADAAPVAGEVFAAWERLRRKR